MIEILLIVGIICLQTWFGYLENKWLGAIFPILGLLLYLYLLITGNLSLSFTNVVMPVIGLLAFLGLWESGRKSKRDKQSKELDKMKAKDRQ